MIEASLYSFNNCLLHHYIIPPGLAGLKEIPFEEFPLPLQSGVTTPFLLFRMI